MVGEWDMNGDPAIPGLEDNVLLQDSDLDTVSDEYYPVYTLQPSK